MTDNTSTYDVIVIGAGPAGEVAAGRMAERGKSVAIVERRLVGGECSFYACIPSKALLRPVGLLAEVRRVPGAAEATDRGLDTSAVLARRDELIGHLDDSGQLPWLETRGVSVVRGSAQVTGPRQVTVDDQVLSAADAVVIATGSTAAVPAALVPAKPWTNREVTTAGQVPGRLAIVGGGVVAAEMAEAYCGLGSSVTVIVRDNRLLGREEDFAGELVTSSLREQGVDIRFGASVASASRADGGPVSLDLGDGTPVEVDEVLAATGRIPNTDGLGLESIGVQLDRGYVPTDARMRVPGHDWLYAIGDANGRTLLTHQGKYQGRIVADLVTGSSSARTRGLTAPPTRVIFTDPQVAAVGHTAPSAAAAGLKVDVLDIPLESSAGSSYIGRGAGGQIRVVIDPDRDVIVGATFVGPEVSELLHAATIAVTGEVPLRVLADAVPAFPTRNEVWLGILDAAGY
jgi:pyruvate/2-oxoglutarate dehydrogenase complex dihydrolipoamide dehydrogenase (E3) component